MHPPGPDFSGDRQPEQFEGISTPAIHLAAVIAIVLAATGVLPWWLLLIVVPAWLWFGFSTSSIRDGIGPVEGLLVWNRDPEAHQRDDRRR